VSSVIEQMKRHFAAFGTQSIEVPEWGEDGKPLVIYYTPMTLAEKQRLDYALEREGRVGRLADALIMKALDAQGKPLYTVADKKALREEVDPDVLARVVVRMMTTPSIEDMEKNSKGTPSSG
jgi:hypothetical protein